MTWDSTKFPTPERMIHNIAEKGRKMVVIIDPHVKKDNNYPIFKEAESKQYYVKKNDKTTDFDGLVLARLVHVFRRHEPGRSRGGHLNSPWIPIKARRPIYTFGTI